MFSKTWVFWSSVFSARNAIPFFFPGLVPTKPPKTRCRLLLPAHSDPAAWLLHPAHPSSGLGLLCSPITAHRHWLKDGRDIVPPRVYEPRCGSASTSRKGWFFFFEKLFLAALGLQAACGLSLVSADGGYSLVVVCGPFIMVTSLVAEHRL